MAKRVGVAMVVALACATVASAQGGQRADAFGAIGLGGLAVGPDKLGAGGRYAPGDDDLHGGYRALVRAYR